MIIKSLTLQNIRSYTDAHIEFPSGSILLAGDIGCGKSTILQAIEFALFGIMRGDLDASALLRTGTNRGSVTLTFALGEQNITITRALVRGKQAITQDTGSLTIGDEEQKLTATELRKRMIELLAYPQALASKSPSLVFRYTVYTSQEQMKEILSQSPQERLETLRAVFGIDNYSKIKENATTIARALRERIAYLEGQLSSEPIILEQIETAKTDHDALLARQYENIKAQESARKQLLATEKEYELLQKTVAALSSVSSTVQNLQLEIQTLLSQETELILRIQNAKTQRDALQKELNESGKITLDLEAEQTLLQEKRQLYNHVQKVQKELETVAARLASVQTKIENATQIEKKKESLQLSRDELFTKEKELQSQAMLLPAVQKELDELNVELIKITASHAAASIERDRLTIQIDHTHESGICELCLQEVTPQQQELSKEQKKQRLAQVMQAITVGATEREEMERKKQLLVQTLARYQITISTLSQMQGKRQAIEQELVNASTDKEELSGHLRLIEQEHVLLREQATQLSSQIIVVDSQLDIVRAQKEKSIRLMQYEQRIADMHTQIKQQENDLQTQRARIAAKQNEHSRLQVQLSSLDSLKKQEQQTAAQRLMLREAEEVASQTAAQAVALLANAKQVEKQLREQLSKMEVIKTQLTTSNYQRQWIQTYFTNVMDIIEQHVFSTVHADFNSHFQKWLGMLLDDEAINVTLDATLSPQIRQNGYDVSVNQLSGGEKTSVALAYRLALNRVISDVFASIKTKNLLILDEPTDGFSEEQLDRVRDVLTALPSGQLVIVSHEPKVETFVDHVLRVTKSQHISTITSGQSITVSQK